MRKKNKFVAGLICLTALTDEQIGKVFDYWTFNEDWATTYWRLQGFTLIILGGFYGDRPDEIGFDAARYISTTQPDCRTSRGIADHDGCFVYAPADTSRSILFLVKGEVIVQIDMVDGLDRQIRTPLRLGI